MDAFQSTNNVILADESAPTSFEQRPASDSTLMRDIVRAHHTLTTLFAHQIGITEARLNMLRQFKQSHRDTNEVSQAELCTRLGVNPAVVTRQIKQLEEEGLVVRRADPRDNRITLAKLTEKGEGVLADLLRRSDAFEGSLLDGFTSDEVQTARFVLNHLRARLESAPRVAALPVQSANDVVALAG